MNITANQLKVNDEFIYGNKRKPRVVKSVEQFNYPNMGDIVLVGIGNCRHVTLKPNDVVYLVSKC